MSQVLATTACNLDKNILQACLPLLAQSKVDAFEWSFDALFRFKKIPDWFIELIDAFSQENRLIGHGIFYSVFSGNFTDDQASWLKKVKQVASRFNFDHMTEHFGFMAGEDFHNGAPLSFPMNNKTLTIGEDRLSRLADAAQCPIGLENLALAYSKDDVKRQSAFLSNLLNRINGFMILDLHNLYCQSHNFDIDLNTLIGFYDLELVREIHISGGSWEAFPSAPDKRVRRDTHDNRVPDVVFQALEDVLNRCPNLKYVVLEQLGTGLVTEESRISYREDFIKMKSIIQRQPSQSRTTIKKYFNPRISKLSDQPVIDQDLFKQQNALSELLKNTSSLSHAHYELQNSELASSDWEIEKWEDHMLETARLITSKWLN